VGLDEDVYTPLARPRGAGPPAAGSAETTVQDVATPRRASMALPFKDGEAVPPPSALPDLPPLAPRDQHGTMGLGEPVISPLARMVLPFAKAAGKTAPGSHDEVDEPTALLDAPPSTPLREEAPTTRLPAAVLAAAERAAARCTPELSIEQYAWLAVRCESEPESTRAMCLEHGIATAQALRTLEETWHKRLAANPAVRARFDQLVAHYRGWIAQRRR
jgi:hypothetical protein